MSTTTTTTININNNNDVSDRSDFNIQIPKDADVSSPKRTTSAAEDNNNNPAPPPADKEFVRQTGNPQINQELPINFQMTMSIVPGVDNDLMVEDLDAFLEFYLERRYQILIDILYDQFALASPPNLQIQGVDLTVSEITSFFNNRSRRVLRMVQESTELISVDVDGNMVYTVQVDGSSITPQDIQEQWSNALGDIVSQPRLNEAVLEAEIEGIVRVDQVQVQNADVNRQEDGTNNNNTSDGSVPWADSPNNVGNSSPDLERPSTLSIIFGFVLTGIAALGLLGYCYIFYRKRKKRLRKKRQMKESISYPPAALSKINPNGSTSGSSRMAPSTSARQASQVAPVASSLAVSPMIISPADDTFSEDTSYKGVGSSIGSEDASDAFAKELQRAASLDQQAWDEFQRKKHVLDKSQAVRSSPPSNEKSATEKVSTQMNANPAPASLLGRHNNMSSDEEGIDPVDAMEAAIKGNTTWAKSFPYGDENGDDDDDDDEWVMNPTTSRTSRYQVSGQEEKWEPYNSALPPSPIPAFSEEKKDEISPTGFFAKQLENIEMDLARYGVQSSANSSSGENDLSTVEILSEVEELSKYVRRYEQRRDRKSKREMELHERMSTAGTSTSASTSMSVGMDGRIYNSKSPVAPSTPSSASSMSTLQPPPGDLSSYAGSYMNTQKYPPQSETNLSFVSDDEDGNSELLRGRTRRYQPEEPTTRYLSF